MSNYRRFIPVLLLPACLIFTSTAQAESVVITSGSYTADSADGGVDFDLTGAGLRITGTGSTSGTYVGPSGCFPCSEGSLDSAATSSDIFGSVTYQGQVYKLVDQSEDDFEASATLEFLAGDFVVPDELKDAAAVRITGLFNFAGRSASNGLAPFSIDFYGSGVVRLLLTQDPGSDDFEFERVEYEFLAPGAPRPQPGVEAIPEPTTMILLGTGLAGLGGALRKRRQHRTE